MNLYADSRSNSIVMTVDINNHVKIIQSKLYVFGIMLKMRDF